MFNLYRIISFFAIPIIIINIYIRIYKKKEDKKRYKERFGISTISRPNKKVIWIHAASIGEFKSSNTLIDNYYKTYCILVTTTTKSAAEYANKYFGDKIIHQFAPFDIDIWVNKFINHWKPNLVLWIESDLWPNTLKIIKKNNIKSFFLNARISPKSFKRWLKFSYIYDELIQTFSIIFAQSIDDKKRISRLSSQKIEFIGNLKLTSNLNEIYTKDKNSKNIITIMFTSTHENEEFMLLPLIKKFYKKYNNSKFYIAPRHPERSKSINKLFNQNNISSFMETNSKNKDRVIIIDSFGNLENFYKISDIVFLGGSLSKNGGHNPIEPAKYNCAIISGNNIFNWKNIYDEMSIEKACHIIDNIDKLEKMIENLIINKNILKTFKKNALNFSKKNFYNDNKLIDLINKELTKDA